jgi:DNA-binding transcriptional regulator YbjK
LLAVASGFRAERRAVLISAAAEVLRTRGVAGCTARAVAELSGLSKSSIHYYFEEIDQLIDLAYERLMGQFVDAMEKAAAGRLDPFEGLWAAAEVYLVLGTTRPGRIPMMAFDYLVASSRRGKSDALIQVNERITNLLHELVAATDVRDASLRADVLVSALVGSVVRAEISPRDPDATLARISEVVGIPRQAPKRRGAARRSTRGQATRTTAAP